MVPFVEVNTSICGFAATVILFMQLRMMQISLLFMVQSHVPKRRKSYTIYVKKMSKIELKIIVCSIKKQTYTQQGN